MRLSYLTYRYMPDQTTLFTQEVRQFDPWVLRELLNNCIAHSDYSIGGRIYVNEFEDKLILTNPGSFIPENVEVILRPSYGKPFGMMNSKSIPGLQVLGEILILAGFFRFWRNKLDKLTIYS